MQTSGNDIFYRNPYDVNECLFVNLSSPSSSKYKSVRSIGTPDAVAEKARRQYLREMMSTRLGVKRESDVVSSADRIGSDGNEYYDLQVALEERRILRDVFCADCMSMQVRMKSYASRAQLAVTQAEIDAATELEWDRRLITVLGSANNRLYEFRLQTANSTYETSKVRHVTSGHIPVCCNNRIHIHFTYISHTFHPNYICAGTIAGNGKVFHVLYS